MSFTFLHAAGQVRRSFLLCVVVIVGASVGVPASDATAAAARESSDGEVFDIDGGEFDRAQLASRQDEDAQDLFELDGQAARAAAGSSDPTAPKRLPAPAAAAIAEAEKLVREAHGDAYAKRGRGDRLALALKLLEQAGEADPEGDGATHYVLLREARDLAAAGGDVELALSAAEEIAAAFRVNRAATKLAALAPAAKVADAAELARALISVSQDGIAEGDWPVASKAAAMAAAAAGRVRDDKAMAVRARAQPAVVTRARKSADAAASAKAKLAEDPDDPAANATLGRHLCFVTGKWDEGLPHLAKGSDPLLKALAAREARAPDDANAMAALAEAWWKAADKAAKDDAATLRQRAAFWYRLAVPDLTGIKKVAAEKRVAEVDAGDAAGSRPKVLRLVALIDGTDDIELSNAQVKWVHVSWGEAKDVQLNGARWDVARTPVLKNSQGVTQFLSRLPTFAHTSVRKIRGGGTVTVVAEVEKAVITIEDGGLGADTYELEVTFHRPRKAAAD